MQRRPAGEPRTLAGPARAGGPSGAPRAGDARPVADRRRRLVVLAACSLSLFIVSMDVTIVNVALPSIQRTFGASLSGLQWVVDAYVLVVASLLLLSGSMGDRFGRRRVFQTGLVIFAAGSLACSLAPSLGALVAFRMLQAVGGSMLNPNSLSVMSSVFTDPRERAQAIGIWGGVFGVSAAAGPVVGGILIDSVGWRSIFWVNIPIAVLAFVLMARYAPESRAERPRRADLPGQGLVIVVLATLAFGIIEGPYEGWASPTILGCFGACLLALAFFLLVERRQPQPLLELRFFRSPPFSGAATIAVTIFYVLSGFLFLNTLYLQEVRGYSALVAGLATLPATTVIIVAAPLTGRFVGRRGSRLPLSLAGLAMTAGCVVLAQDRPHSAYLGLAAGYVLIGLALGMANPPITNTAVAGMPAAQTGVAAAVASSSRQVGNVLGVALTGAIVTSALHRALARKVPSLPVPEGVRHALLHVTVGATGLQLPRRTPDLSHITRLVNAAFTGAGHDGWYVAAAAGVITFVVGLTTTGPAGRCRAEAVLAEPARSEPAPAPGRP
ncbi:MAG TPA: MFS transporter [Acidimicrobiales bacterium]|nr:MFS transporter [Acidimicrobiales bacterium]